MSDRCGGAATVLLVPTCTSRTRRSHRDSRRRNWLLSRRQLIAPAAPGCAFLVRFLTDSSDDRMSMSAPRTFIKIRFGILATTSDVVVVKHILAAQTKVEELFCKRHVASLCVALGHGRED
ncbi:hypothetical protein MPTK1_5g14760 [Marchantia polymorpha subsp. ruderalis]|uniref:Uncharacterized protein n=2 Tax=Marchantia polymorpha TaxID=3197 RepID=A0AAF6BIF5_MARPO|nr:hypothetical protein MARPO_0032s0167 [Marchantia polymorpha]BBN11789.1 hypothetical protein Mp_5g14760 [Marchantia polymorpha subsp. ruderalis]|eukprot:PTQ42006.1 hypothetical protein MARPO_0032s0167 [Marchantia polymorpha]